jgi:hypothetical protein
MMDDEASTEDLRENGLLAELGGSLQFDDDPRNMES